MVQRAHGTRRSRSRRRLVLTVVGLVGLVAASAFAMQGDDFPARSQPMRGAPVELLVQDGVRASDVRAVSAGVRRAHRFIRVALGRTVHGPVKARIARRDPCPGADGDRSVIGKGGAGGLCIDTTNVQWQWLSRSHRAAAAAIPAHEYVHVLQAQLGCLPAGGDRRYRWLVEGMASQIGWAALVWSGSVRDADTRRAIRRDGAFGAGLEPLRRYESAGGRTPQYARWHLAIRHLLDGAAGPGPASARRPESALIRFCEQVGAGRSWRRAFIASFGVSVFDFYARFERAMREVRRAAEPLQ